MSQKIYTDLDIKGNTTIGSIANATTDTDKFLVSDNGLVKYRTGAEMLSDLGVAPGVASNIQHQVKAGVAINKGQAVYVTSADGTNMIVGLASNTSEATSSKTMGLLASTVAINGFANVITEGLLAGLNTIGATAGDPVWLGTDGNLIYGLINKPSAPAHLVFIGIVTRVNASNGEIFVKVQNGFEFNEIHDVDLKTTTPVNGDILGFNGTLWVNKTIAAWLGYTPANASGTNATGNWGISITGNAATATKLQTARTIGGVSFDGTANINLPGVNTTGNQSTTGNAATATTLQTARTINGTSFNGSANITTANWGTGRTITIGSTGKTVDGSGNVSWTLAEIGAQAAGSYAASSHTHPISQITNLQTTLDSKAPTTSQFVQSSRDFPLGTLISTTIDYSQTNGDSFLLELKGNTYSGGVPLDMKVQGYIYYDTIINTSGYTINSAFTYVRAMNIGGFLCFWIPTGGYWQGFDAFCSSTMGGGSINKVTTITNSAEPDGTKKVTINLTYAVLSNNTLLNNWNAAYNDKINSASLTASTLTLSQQDGTTITASVPTFNQSTTGNAATATTLQTARTLTIGNTGKTFDGSANVAWSLSEIGAMATSHAANAITSTDINTWNDAVTKSGTQTITGNKTFNSIINFSNNVGGIQGTIGDNDYWRIIGNNTTSNAGYLEIATADDGNEPIYVRQYTGVFSSLTRTAVLLDGAGNTSFPGTITAPTFSGTSATFSGDINAPRIRLRDDSIEHIGAGDSLNISYVSGNGNRNNTVIYDGQSNIITAFNGTTHEVNFYGDITSRGKAFINLSGNHGLSPSISLAIGDSDTGFNWEGDGNISYYSNSTKRFDLNNVWHSGNDGAGSGLDADLLDGKQGHQFINLEWNSLTQGNNVNYNEIVYPINKNIWYIQPYHGGNYTGQLNTPPVGSYGTILTMSGTDTAFYHQLAIGNGGELAIRSAYASDKFTTPWVRYWSTNNFTDSNINNWNTAYGWGNHASAGYALANGTVNYIPKFTASGTLGNSIIYDNGTNVGIGTNTPTATLEVSSSNYTGIAISRPIQNAGVYIQAKGYDTGNIYRVSSQITFDQVSDTFWVNGGISFATASSGSLVTRWKILTDGTFQSNGAGKIETSSSNLTLNAPFGDIYLMPQSTKNVGIGTISPSEKLDVNGNIKAIDIIDQQGISIYLKLKTVNGNVTIDNSYHNKIVRITASCTITIPAGLRTDFNCTFEVIGAYTAQFVDGSGATTSAPFGRYLKTDLTAMFYCTGTASNYRLNGSLTTS